MASATESVVPYALAARTSGRAGTEIAVRDVVIGGPEFVVIAGPCSVETSDEVRRIVGRVAGSGAALFRAGAALRPIDSCVRRADRGGAPPTRVAGSSER